MTGKRLQWRNCGGILVVGMPRLLGLSLILSSLITPTAGMGSAQEPTSKFILESSKPGAGLPCHVMPEKPDLGFDLRFHAVYHVRVPVKVLANIGSPLKVTIMVTPTGAEEPAHFVRWFHIPDIPPGARGEALLGDGVELGTGRFRVAWAMQDSRGRVCSSHWEWEAKLGRRQRDFPLTLREGTVAEWAGGTLGTGGLDGIRPANPRKVKVLLNLSPTKPWHSTLRPEDSNVLFSILRGLAQEPGVSYSGLLAFNLREQRIVYSADNKGSIDLASLREALHAPATGTVSYRLLQNPSSETDFATKLLAGELGAGTVAPDAIVIIGPKVTLGMKVPLESLKQSGAVHCPIFYFNYNPNPVDEPFRDTIGSALKAYKAAMAYNIVFPNDLGAAVRDILFRIDARPR
jgi:hypothetical protein